MKLVDSKPLHKASDFAEAMGKTIGEPRTKRREFFWYNAFVNI
jgi:hypothetical protein